MYALIIAGGTGTRLWPLSREEKPKQLQNLVGEESLIAQTVARVTPLIDTSNIWVVTGTRYVPALTLEVPQVSPHHIVAEPFPVGTNLAVGLGAIYLEHLDPDAVMLVAWADAYIGNQQGFLAGLKLAGEVAAAGDADGVLLGVRPTYPATCYGYMEMGEELPDFPGAYAVKRFEEKPVPDRARQFLDTGAYVWNPGISVWRASRLLELIKRFKPEHYRALAEIREALGSNKIEEVTARALKGLEPEPIDTAVCEKAERMVTIPCDMNWSDIGSWDALYDVQAMGSENVTRGNVVAVDTKGCLIYGKDRLVATLGLTDLVIVDAGDAILVARREDADRLKELHTAIKKGGHTEYL